MEADRWVRGSWMPMLAVVAGVAGAVGAACGGAGSRASAADAGVDAAGADGPVSGHAEAGGADAPGLVDAARDTGIDVEGEGGGMIETVHFIGRFDTRDATGPRFAWPGSAIAATFTGTGISVQMHDAGTNYFTVVIDGGSPTVVPTTSATDTYTLASGLSAGTHTLMLTKRTESYVGVVQYLGLTPAGGALVPSPFPFTRRIEYVGDSITCGYGDLGMGPGCHFSDDTEDETIAYGALSASQLAVQQTVIAYSGIGVVRDANGGTTNQMPVRFQLTLADDPTSAWGFTTPPPDVVVINLGTNDFAAGDPGTVFETTYVAFIQQLRSVYPQAYVIGTLSPMLSDPARSQARAYIQGAIGQLADAGVGRVSFLEFAEQLASDGYGCDYHPSPTTHQKMAATLVPALTSLAGW